MYSNFKILVVFKSVFNFSSSFVNNLMQKQKKRLLTILLLVCITHAASKDITGGEFLDKYTQETSKISRMLKNKQAIYPGHLRCEASLQTELATLSQKLNSKMEMLSHKRNAFVKEELAQDQAVKLDPKNALQISGMKKQVHSIDRTADKLIKDWIIEEEELDDKFSSLSQIYKGLSEDEQLLNQELEKLEKEIIQYESSIKIDSLESKKEEDKLDQEFSDQVKKHGYDPTKITEIIEIYEIWIEEHIEIIKIYEIIESREISIEESFTKITESFIKDIKSKVAMIDAQILSSQNKLSSLKSQHTNLLMKKKQSYFTKQKLEKLSKQIDSSTKLIVSLQLEKQAHEKAIKQESAVTKNLISVAKKSVDSKKEVKNATTVLKKLEKAKKRFIKKSSVKIVKHIHSNKEKKHNLIEDLVEKSSSSSNKHHHQANLLEYKKKKHSTLFDLQTKEEKEKEKEKKKKTKSLFSVAQDKVKKEEKKEASSSTVHHHHHETQKTQHKSDLLDILNKTESAKKSEVKHHHHHHHHQIKKKKETNLLSIMENQQSKVDEKHYHHHHHNNTKKKNSTDLLSIMNQNVKKEEKQKKSKVDLLSLLNDQVKAESKSTSEKKEAHHHHHHHHQTKKAKKVDVLSMLNSGVENKKKVDVLSMLNGGVEEKKKKEKVSILSIMGRETKKSSSEENNHHHHHHEKKKSEKKSILSIMSIKKDKKKSNSILSIMSNTTASSSSSSAQSSSKFSHKDFEKLLADIKKTATEELKQEEKAEKIEQAKNRVFKDFKVMPKLPEDKDLEDACRKKNIFTINMLIHDAEEDKKVALTSEEDKITLHKIIVRENSYLDIANGNLNLLKIVMVANLKEYLLTSEKLPVSLKDAFDMEIIQELLEKVEKWMAYKLAIMGITKFNIWVDETVIKLQALDLLEDPETIRCAETMKLLRMEPHFDEKLSAAREEAIKDINSGAVKL